MAPRASWKGYLKLSLVSCPVRLYNATSSGERISFNLLHKDTHNRVQMKPVDPELGQVERSDLVKGYQYEKNQYVILDDEDFEKVRIETTETINIEAFVDEDSVDGIYLDAPYYLAPDGAVAEETFVVIREAMKKAKKVAVARLVLSSRERVVTIGVRDNGMLVQTLRRPQEVRGETAYFEGIPANGADKEMLDLAMKLIEQKSSKFDPSEYEDRYEEALLQVIKAKIAGEEPVVTAAPARGNVINLMDALKKSLEGEKPPAGSKARKTSAKTPAAKPTTKKKAAPKRKSA
jgi:DNA end-binding protein Ku